MISTIDIHTAGLVRNRETSVISTGIIGIQLRRFVHTGSFVSANVRLFVLSSASRERAINVLQGGCGSERERERDGHAFSNRFRVPDNYSNYADPIHRAHYYSAATSSKRPVAPIERLALAHASDTRLKRIITRIYDFISSDDLTRSLIIGQASRRSNVAETSSCVNCITKMQDDDIMQQTCAKLNAFFSS